MKVAYHGGPASGAVVDLDVPALPPSLAVTDEGRPHPTGRMTPGAVIGVYHDSGMDRFDGARILEWHAVASVEALCLHDTVRPRPRRRKDNT